MGGGHEQFSTESKREGWFPNTAFDRAEQVPEFASQLSHWVDNLSDLLYVSASPHLIYIYKKK